MSKIDGSSRKAGKNHPPKRIFGQRVSLLSLLVMVAMGCGLQSVAIACIVLPRSLSTPTPAPTPTPTPISTPSAEPETVPQTVVDRVLDDYSSRMDIAKEDLSILRHSRETWSDSCLGLGTATESCLAETVEGWQLEVVPAGREDQSYFYRTDLTGNIIRFAEQDNNLPPSVSDRLIQFAAQDRHVSAADLTVSHAIPKLWDGCLGIYQPDLMCTAIGIFGWQAIVSDGNRSWVYHMNGDGSDIRFNAIASLTTSVINPDLHRATSLNLPEHVLFWAITSGGFAGRTSAIRLLDNGTVEYLPADADGTADVQVLRRLSPEQVQDFTNVLEQHQFRNFNGVAYQPAAGAADFFTVTLISPGGFTAYADMVQSDLPADLQQIIQEWNQIAAR